MGTAPIGITEDAIKKDDYLKYLRKGVAHLQAHPEEKLYDGKTLQELHQSIKDAEGFEFLR